MADIARVPSLNISGIDVKQPIVAMYGDNAGVFSSSALGDGNIGGDILRRYTVYFDYAAHRMIWESHDATAEAFEADMSGLQFAVNRNGPGYTVEYVVPKSPGGELGIAKGDVVVEIDGKPATVDVLDELRKRLRRDGERVRITVKRGVQPMVFELVTRRLV
jgi:C-terminal processing protease CtpA/Prc